MVIVTYRGVYNMSGPITGYNSLPVVLFPLVAKRKYSVP